MKHYILKLKHLRKKKAFKTYNEVPNHIFTHFFFKNRLSCSILALLLSGISFYILSINADFSIENTLIENRSLSFHQENNYIFNKSSLSNSADSAIKRYEKGLKKILKPSLIAFICLSFVFSAMLMGNFISALISLCFIFILILNLLGILSLANLKIDVFNFYAFPVLTLMSSIVYIKSSKFFNSQTRIDINKEGKGQEAFYYIFSRILNYDIAISICLFILIFFKIQSSFCEVLLIGLNLNLLLALLLLPTCMLLFCELKWLEHPFKNGEIISLRYMLVFVSTLTFYYYLNISNNLFSYNLKQGKASKNIIYLAIDSKEEIMNTKMLKKNLKIILASFEKENNEKVKKELVETISNNLSRYPETLPVVIFVELFEKYIKKTLFNNAYVLKGYKALVLNINNEMNQVKLFRKVKMIRYISELQNQLSVLPSVSHTFSIINILDSLNVKKIAPSDDAIAKKLVEWQKLQNDPYKLYKWISSDFMKINIMFTIDKADNKTLINLDKALNNYIASKNNSYELSYQWFGDLYKNYVLRKFYKKEFIKLLLIILILILPTLSLLKREYL